MKIKIVCRTERTTKEGSATLYLRLTHNRVNKFVSLGISVNPLYWDSEAQILTPNCPDRQLLQTKIDAAVEPYLKKIRQYEALEIEVTFDSLLGTKTKHLKCTVTGYLEQRISDLETQGKYGSAVKHNHSTDFNGYYPKDAIEGDANYSGGKKKLILLRLRLKTEPLMP